MELKSAHFTEIFKNDPVMKDKINRQVQNTSILLKSLTVQSKKP